MLTVRSLSPRVAATRSAEEEWRREWDSNPRNRCRFTGIPVQRLRPLGHLSARIEGAQRTEGDPTTQFRDWIEGDRLSENRHVAVPGNMTADRRDSPPHRCAAGPVY